jgi:hypothetical protein
VVSSYVSCRFGTLYQEKYGNPDSLDFLFHDGFVSFAKKKVNRILGIVFSVQQFWQTQFCIFSR